MKLLHAVLLCFFIAHPPALCASRPPRASNAGQLIGRDLQPVYEAAVGSGAAPAGDGTPLALPPRLLELLRVVGQHLYHNVTGEGGRVGVGREG